MKARKRAWDYEVFPERTLFSDLKCSASSLASLHQGIDYGTEVYIWSDSVDTYHSKVSKIVEGKMTSEVLGYIDRLALKDIDGSLSFLEKAPCFIERYGNQRE